MYALGFSSWKKPTVRKCFPDTQIVFTNSIDNIGLDTVIAVWGMCREVDKLAASVKLFRIEDGFLRSVGLGADLIRPVSWVVDSQGIYYDATRPSDLEILLSTTTFEPGVFERAVSLRQRIVSEGLTKYNVGTMDWLRPLTARKVILVPGQVESDDSLNYGAPKIRSNIDLLKSVRQANPNAYVVYKPHPDVVAGLRAKGVEEHQVTQWCDEIVTDTSMADLLTKVDEVHVLTSLAGFEALLRGKKVVCYGQPFYSGWGLTTDLIPHPRRGRKLLLDELVAAALIMYPKYFSRTSNALISPEQALDELSAWKAKHGGVVPWWRQVFRYVLRRVVGVR